LYALTIDNAQNVKFISCSNDNTSVVEC